MTANGHGRWDDTLAAYLLGALPDAEVGEFEGHLAGCERCRDEAASLHVAVDVLAVAVPPVNPPRDLKARVMRVVESEAELLRAAGTEADRPARRRRGLRGLFPRPVITAAAAAAALAVGVVAGIAIVGGDDGGGGQRTLAARVTDPLAATTARASLVVDGSRAKLVVRGMPAPESGRVYQVWLKRPGGSVPVPAGATFMLRSGDVAIPRAVRDGDQVMVTSEPEGGSPAPTRRPIVVAQPV
jgi:anti-sigma-K factor RskA